MGVVIRPQHRGDLRRGGRVLCSTVGIIPTYTCGKSAGTQHTQTKSQRVGGLYLSPFSGFAIIP